MFPLAVGLAALAIVRLAEYWVKSKNGCRSRYARGGGIYRRLRSREPAAKTNVWRRRARVIVAIIAVGSYFGTKLGGKTGERSMGAQLVGCWEWRDHDEHEVVALEPDGSFYMVLDGVVGEAPAVVANRWELGGPRRICDCYDDSGQRQARETGEYREDRPHRKEPVHMAK